MGSLSSHPLGIARVRPEEDLLTLQLVDERVILDHWVEFPSAVTAPSEHDRVSWDALE